MVIGGVGGSGTRVVAEIIKAMGYYTGSLNKANDNVQFAKKFSKPGWFRRHHKNNQQIIYRRMEKFEKEMLALKENQPSHYIGWGWKNPITHIYLEYLTNYFKRIKYIHVIRNGLEMAYSTNQNQLKKWGRLYQIKSSSEPDPKASLQYWYAANERAIRLGKKRLGRHFLLINYNHLCSNPKDDIKKIITFLELEPAKMKLEPLIQLVQPPKTLKRYENQDLSRFTKDDFALVRKLGFEI
ncbi:MAG TPA: sulfotransferase [Bacillales bacterium]|nr:sulfotransferase [Bacillales bacterium]